MRKKLISTVFFWVWALASLSGPASYAQEPLPTDRNLYWHLKVSPLTNGAIPFGGAYDYKEMRARERGFVRVGGGVSFKNRYSVLMDFLSYSSEIHGDKRSSYGIEISSRYYFSDISGRPRWQPYIYGAYNNYRMHRDNGLLANLNIGLCAGTWWGSSGECEDIENLRLLNRGHSFHGGMGVKRNFGHHLALYFQLGLGRTAYRFVRSEEGVEVVNERRSHPFIAYDLFGLEWSF